MKKYLMAASVCLLGFSFQTFAQMTLIWKNDTALKGPESVVYDNSNHCLYVSNFNRNPNNGENYNEDYVSKLDLQGELIEKKFVAHLTCPTGLFIHNGKLLIVERFGVVQFDIASQKTETRYRIADPGFLNDVAADPSGNIYVTVSNKQAIYRISGNAAEKWLESDELAGINGIIVDGSKLIVGITGDSCLKSVSLNDKQIEIIARFSAGVIDGIKKYQDDYLVSHFEGNIYRVNKDGKVTGLLDTREQKIGCADFEFIENEGIFVIPSLRNNILVAYKYNPW